MVKPSASMCVFCAFRATSTRRARLPASARYRLRGQQVHSSAARSQGQNAAFQPKEENQEEDNGYSAWQPASNPSVSKWARGPKSNDNGVNTATNPSAPSHWATTSPSQYNPMYHMPSENNNSTLPSTSNPSAINWPTKSTWNTNASPNNTQSDDGTQPQSQTSWATQSTSAPPSSSSPWSNQSPSQTLNSSPWGTQSHNSSVPSSSPTVSHKPLNGSTTGATSKWARTSSTPPTAFTNSDRSSSEALVQPSAHVDESHAPSNANSPWKASSGASKWARSSPETKDTSNVSSYDGGQHLRSTSENSAPAEQSSWKPMASTGTSKWSRGSSATTQPTNPDSKPHDPLDFSAETLLGGSSDQTENTVPQGSARGTSKWQRNNHLKSDTDASSMSFDLSAEALLGQPAAAKNSSSQYTAAKPSKWAMPSQTTGARPVIPQGLTSPVPSGTQDGSDFAASLEHLAIEENNPATESPTKSPLSLSNWASSGHQETPAANLFDVSANSTPVENIGKPKAKNWARSKPADAPIDPSKPSNWGTAGGNSVLNPTSNLEPVSFFPQPEPVVEKPSRNVGNAPSMRSFRSASELPGFEERERDQFASLVDSMEAHQRQRRSTWSSPSPNSGQQFSPLSQQSQDGRPSWAQPLRDERTPWMKRARDEKGSSGFQQDGRNQQAISWRQHSRDNGGSGSRFQSNRNEASWQDESARGYNNGQRSFQQQQQPQGDFGAPGRSRSFGSEDYAPEASAIPARPKYDAEAEVGWKKKKKKDFKSKDRQKHGREFITDDLSIEEEMRAMMAAKQARKQASYQEIQKLPEIYLPEYISIGNLAHLLKVHLEPFMQKLRQLGFEDTSPEYVLNAENAGLIAMEYNYEPKMDTSAVDDLFPRPVPEDKSNLPLRPPVVTIMGHVDHGKTTILDWLRKSSIAAGEFGGITQHIGAFSVPMPSGKVITFLDTPGHAAFLTMRERGANVTDIVILVVAADDGVMPQTIEAIKHAQAAKVPMIVAVNKCDKPDADPQRVKSELGRYNVELEEYGGDTQVVEVSGLKGLGMEELEESTILLSEVLDMRADPTGPCEGWVIEATTKKRGRVATILVRCGTLKVGDVLVAGTSWTRVKTLLDEHGRELESAGPGMPVEIDGWRDTPVAGDEVLEAPSEDKAKSVVDFRNLKIERAKQASDMEAINEARRKERERIEREAYIAEQAKLGIEVTEEAPVDEGPKVISVPYIVKADVYGSVEAVTATILAIGNDEIHSRIVRSGVGPLSQSDIDFAAAVGATCITFNVETDPIVAATAKAEKVDIIEHNIIYQVETDVKERMSAKLPPTISRTVTGEADVAQIFDYNLKGRTIVKVAGCKVRNGVMKRNSKVRVLRKKKVVYDGVLTTLKNVKKDVPEMRKNSECGISFEGWQDFQEGDAIQCYHEISTPRTLA